MNLGGLERLERVLAAEMGLAVKVEMDGKAMG